MVRRSSGTRSEGLTAARLMMVVASMWPVFVFSAVRGNDLITDHWFIAFCSAMVVIPNAFLLLRIHIARKRRDTRSFSVGASEEHRSERLLYLFAMLLPLHVGDIETWRELWASAAALTFIAFLFWHLNLHYINPAFAVFGYRVFTISLGNERHQLAGRRYTVITKRRGVRPGDWIRTHRLSETVYLMDH